ncbi:MAG: GreA/GreB family elongation factor [Myxococcota bacterium]
MPQLPDKERTLAAVRAAIDARLAELAASQQASQAGATHSETRQENPKDTRAIEAGYLARGLAERVEALREAQATLAGLRLEPFDAGDGMGVNQLAALEADDGDERLVFLLPAGGGIEVNVDDETVSVLTPQAPLGRALLGCAPGEEVDVKTPRAAHHYRVIAIA